MPFHPNFKLNNTSFANVEELLSYTEQFSTDLWLFFKDWFNDNEFMVVQTSGSTGTPKPIQLKKEFMINSALATGSFFELGTETSALLCMSVNYIAGKMMLVRAFTLGWHIDVVMPEANPLKNTQKTYDFCAMVPLQLQASLQELHKVKKLIVGGGVVSPDLYSKIQQVSTEVYATYGMTETITHIAVKKLNHNSINKESYYTTIPGVTIRQDERNCLVIHAPKVSKEDVVTNDVVKVISNISFEWLGRYDNVVNSGGIKLHPETIEEKLALLIPERFFVIGVTDAVLGEKLVLVIETEKNKEKEVQLLSEIEKLEKLGRYERPKAIYFVPKFVETTTKKVQRLKTLELILEK